MSLPTETETYTRIMEHLNRLVEDCTVMAMLRSDNQWVRVADLLGQMREKIRGLAMRKMS